jgi:hypothetical protein
MLLNRPAATTAASQAEKAVLTPAHAAAACVPVETAKRRHALMHGVPSAYWRLRHHHGFVMARPM